MEQISDEKLFELYLIVNPSFQTLDEYKQIAGENYRNVLIIEIQDYLSETHYDGPFEYDPIYYYFKGLSLNKELLKEIPLHARQLKEYHKLKPKQSFKEWKEQESSQNEIIQEIMNHLSENETDWHIDFTKLTNIGREMIFDPLKEFIKNHILTINEIQKYKLQYKVNGEWHSKPLNAETLNDLMTNLEEKHLIYDLDTEEFEYYYEDGGSQLPDWSLFDEIRFSKLKSFKTK